MSHTHIKAVSYAYAPLAPWMWMYTTIAFRKERDPEQRARNEDIKRALLSRSVLFGENLMVPTPEQGGDGKAINDYKEQLRAGMRSASGTMMSREEALKKGKLAALTTDLKGAR